MTSGAFALVNVAGCLYTLSIHLAIGGQDEDSA
jgi:hypothetical protein